MKKIYLILFCLKFIVFGCISLGLQGTNYSDVIPKDSELRPGFVKTLKESDEFLRKIAKEEGISTKELNKTNIILIIFNFFTGDNQQSPDFCDVEYFNHFYSQNYSFYSSRGLAYDSKNTPLFEISYNGILKQPYHYIDPLIQAQLIELYNKMDYICYLTAWSCKGHYYGITLNHIDHYVVDGIELVFIDSLGYK